MIEITDSGVYTEPIQITLAKGQTLQLRAANRTRPVIHMLDWGTSAPDSLSVTGAGECWFVLDGVVVTGRGVQVDGDVSGVAIRHCTLVPGWGLDCDCGPQRPAEPSLTLTDAPLCITIEHSIVGAIQVERNQARLDPLQVCITDSIVDATSKDSVALGSSGKLCAHCVLVIRRSTVFGRVEVHTLELGEDSIFMGDMRACKRQQGCVRFCYVTPTSRTPRRYQCQPDLVEKAVRDAFAAGTISIDERDALLESERLRVEPDFTAARYGNPAYCQLAWECAGNRARGARRIRNGRLPRSLPAAADGKPPYTAQRIHARRHQRRRHLGKLGGVMKDDVTRNTFHALKHFSRVLMQQGRVQLDADWNEQVAIHHHFLRRFAADVMVPAAARSATVPSPYRRSARQRRRALPISR